MPITIEGSFDKLAETIDSLKARITNAQEVKSQLLERAQGTAQSLYDEAIYSGEKSDTIYHTEDELVMSGTTALFIEFGTGIRNAEHDLGMYHHGSYGKLRGGSPKGWLYVGTPGNSPNAYEYGETHKGATKVRTTGEPAQMPMYKAYQQVVDEGQDAIIGALKK